MSIIVYLTSSRDDIARQKSINDEIYLIINREVAKKIIRNECSLYKLNNDGKCFYLPNHPKELIHFGSCEIIDEFRYKSPLVMMNKCGVKLHIIKGDINSYELK